MSVTLTFVFGGPTHKDVGVVWPEFSAAPILVNFRFPGVPVSPPEVPPFTNGCLDTISIKGTGSGPGVFDQASGNLALPVVLSMRHSLSAAFAISNAILCALTSPQASQIPITLTTGTIISPISGATSGAMLNRTTGQIGLVGTSTFLGGFAAGEGCDMFLTGTLSHPLP
jgi:hypothetical protein